MDRRHGMILLDDNEVIFRIYETSDREWKLLHYHSTLITSSSDDVENLLEIIGSFFSTEYAQHIAEWKICSRHHAKQLLRELSRALSISIEDLSVHREQELLCKGMFTELW
jgi:hypothetical protein